MKEKVMCITCQNYELMTCNNQHFCNRFGGYVVEDDFCSRGDVITNKTKRNKSEALYMAMDALESVSKPCDNVKLNYEAEYYKLLEQVQYLECKNTDLQNALIAICKKL